MCKAECELYEQYTEVFRKFISFPFLSGEEKMLPGENLTVRETPPTTAIVTTRSFLSSKLLN